MPGSIGGDNRVMAASNRTHYDVLGIARDADASAVRAAWRLHVQAWHPDRFNVTMRAEAERQTVSINEAYTTLRDSSRRAAYDCRLAADEASAERASQPQPRRATKSAPFAARAAAAPIGSPMAVPAAPRTLGDQVAEAAGDAFGVLRRHPRISAMAVAAVLLAFGGSLTLNALSGPVLPSGGTGVASAASAKSLVADAEQVEDLEALAERARTESAAADAQLQQMLAQDAAAAAAEARAAAIADAAARRRAARTNPGRSASTPPARRIVRVMPSVSK